MVTGCTLRELRGRVFELLGLDATDLPDRTAIGFARGYLPPDNPLIPGPTMVDVTHIDIHFNWAGGTRAALPDGASVEGPPAPETS